MYRDDASSMARVIARLEAELVEYRALGARRRQTVLVAVSVVSSVIAVVVGVALHRLGSQEEALEEAVRACYERAATAATSPTQEPPRARDRRRP